MDVTYSGDVAVFNGMKFRRDKKTGYYQNSTKRLRLHRAVWEHHNGPIPKGKHIHHIDCDKDNNRIENLALIDPSEHERYHSTKWMKENYDLAINNLRTKAIPRASEWHRSKEGRAWHTEHAHRVAQSVKPKEYACEFCGNTFVKKPFGTNKFCSDACKAANRRASGVDDESRVCAYCGETFTVNRYTKTKTCSRRCGCRLRTNQKPSLCRQG